MNQITLTIKPGKSKRVLVELDADKFERLASSLGFYSPEFLKSIERAEQDYRAGRVYEISSLRKWRKKK